MLNTKIQVERGDLIKESTCVGASRSELSKLDFEPTYVRALLYILAPRYQFSIVLKQAASAWIWFLRDKLSHQDPPIPGGISICHWIPLWDKNHVVKDRCFQGL